jgi:DNA invertase Pin-like site-specific DNA recombinase
MSHRPAKRVRCAIYARVSTEHGLEQDFNSLDAQHDAAEAYVRSQAPEGWTLIRARYEDGGYSGGSTDRPALQQLLADIRAGKIEVVVVYKVDRLTRSLADFAKLVELFDAHGVSFVSVTQQFNTTTSMGRLTLNVLLSFAQFEREVTGERIRDKIAAYDLQALSRAWQHRAAPDRSPRPRHPHQGPPAGEWTHDRRHPVHPGPARPSAAQSVLHRRGGLQGQHLPRRTATDPGPDLVRGGPGQALRTTHLPLRNPAELRVPAAGPHVR